MMALPARGLLLVLAVWGCFALPAQQVSAQEPTATTGEAEEPGYLTKASALEEQIETLAAQARQLESQKAQREGETARVLERRIDAAWLEVLDHGQQLAELVIEQEAAGEETERFHALATELLRTLPEHAQSEMRELLAAARVEEDLGEMSAAEQIALEVEQERASKRLVALYNALSRNLELSEGLGLDVSGQADFLARSLADAGETWSLALEIARERAATLTRQVEVLPDDSELAALAKVNTARRDRLNDTLRHLVPLMEKRGLEVVRYRQQLIAATGTVTTDIFDVDVFKSLSAGWLKSVGDWMSDNLPGILFNALLFLLILWAAFTLSGITRRLVARALQRAPAHLSQLLRRMIISSAGNLVLLLGLLFGLAQLGISVGPLLAGLGIAGFIIGFALQDTLGNFASGMMILLYRPYDVGDMIETGGVFGKVSRMSLVNTTILTVDNQTLVLPNSKIWGDVIKNVTAQRERRVDMVFGIGYADDIPRAEQVLNDIVLGHDKVLDEPEAVIRLHTLNESSVDFVVRPWSRTEDYWDVYWDITRAVKMRFDEEGISIPFPQRDVHLFAGEESVLAGLGDGREQAAGT